jgi:hypothetical protein
MLESIRLLTRIYTARVTAKHSLFKDLSLFCLRSLIILFDSNGIQHQNDQVNLVLLTIDIFY